MKILMFGWELPPYITGGLGVACAGLVSGLTQSTEITITFIVPNRYNIAKMNDEFPSDNVKIIAPAPITNVYEMVTTTPVLMKYLSLDTDFAIFLENRASPSQAVTNQTHNNTYSTYGNTSNVGDSLQRFMPEVIKHACACQNITQQHNSFDFDIIHAHDWLTYLPAIQAKHDSGKPLVVHVHSTEYDRNTTPNPAILAIEQRGFDCADIIIAVSDYTRQLVVGRYKQSANKVITLHNANDVRDNTAHITPLPDAKKRITFAGRITEQKGPIYFVQAAAHLIQQRQDLEFFMAGDGDLVDEMKKLVEALHLQEYFHFPGFLKHAEVIQLLASSDVFVMPSISEPFGIVALEALHAGTPVVLSKNCGVAELIPSIKQVNYWDSKAIAKVILSTLTDHDSLLTPSELKKLDEVTWENTARHLLGIYRYLLRMNDPHPLA